MLPLNNPNNGIKGRPFYLRPVRIAAIARLTLLSSSSSMTDWSLDVIMMSSVDGRNVTVSRYPDRLVFVGRENVNSSSRGGYLSCTEQVSSSISSIVGGSVTDRVAFCLREYLTCCQQLCGHGQEFTRGNVSWSLVILVALTGQVVLGYTSVLFGSTVNQNSDSFAILASCLDQRQQVPRKTNHRDQHSAVSSNHTFAVFFHWPSSIQDYTTQSTTENVLAMAAFMGEHAATYYHPLSVAPYFNGWVPYSATVNSVSHNGERQQALANAFPYQQHEIANPYSGFDLNNYNSASQQFPQVVGEAFVERVQNGVYPQLQQHDFAQFFNAQQQQENYGTSLPVNCPPQGQIHNGQQSTCTSYAATNDITVAREAHQDRNIETVDQSCGNSWNEYAIQDLPSMDQEVLPSDEYALFDQRQMTQYGHQRIPAVSLEVVGGTCSGNVANSNTVISRFYNSRGSINISIKGILQPYYRKPSSSLNIRPRRTSPRMPRQQRKQCIRTTSITGFSMYDESQRMNEKSIFTKDLVAHLIEEMLTGKITKAPLQKGPPSAYARSRVNSSEAQGNGHGSSNAAFTGGNHVQAPQSTPAPQPYVLGCASSNRGDGERDTDGSTITLKMLLETPYSPRGKSTRNKELEEYQRIIAEEEVQKKIDELRARDRERQRNANGDNNNANGDANVP